MILHEFSTLWKEASEKSVSPAQHAVACSCEILLQLGAKMEDTRFHGGAMSLKIS